MKTITEFSGFVLKDAMAKKAAFLAEGKTEEEAQGSINEMLKLDEAKGVLYKNVVDMTSSRVDRVKRVVVATKASETEKVPESYFEREGNFYLVEFFADPNARAPARGNDRDDRGGRGGGGRGNDRGRGGRPGGNDRGRESNSFGGGGNSFGGGNAGGGSFGGGGDRPRREVAPAPQSNLQSNLPRPEGAFKPRIEGAPAPVYAKKERAPRPPRAERGAEKTGERKPRPERTERAPRGPKGAGELRLVLKGQSQTTLQGSGVLDTEVHPHEVAPNHSAPAEPMESTATETNSTENQSTQQA